MVNSDWELGLKVRFTRHRMSPKNRAAISSSRWRPALCGAVGCGLCVGICRAYLYMKTLIGWFGARVLRFSLTFTSMCRMRLGCGDVVLWGGARRDE